MDDPIQSDPSTPLNIADDEVNDPKSWPREVFLDPVRRTHLIRRIMERCHCSMRESVCRHAIPQDKARVASISLRLEEIMEYHAVVIKEIPKDVGIPPSIMTHLTDVQWICLRHSHGEDTANWFLNYLQLRSCCPSHRDALEEALIFAQKKSQIHSGNDEGRAPGMTGNNREDPPGIRG